MTALIVAVKGGYTQSVKEILKRNPNVNLTDKDGNTALMIASKEGHTEIVQDLLDAGTYVNIPDRVGYLFKIFLPVVIFIPDCFNFFLSVFSKHDNPILCCFVSSFKINLKTVQSL